MKPRTLSSHGLSISVLCASKPRTSNSCPVCFMQPRILLSHGLSIAVLCTGPLDRSAVQPVQVQFSASQAPDGPQRTYQSHSIHYLMHCGTRSRVLTRSTHYSDVVEVLLVSSPRVAVIVQYFTTLTDIEYNRTVMHGGSQLVDET